MRKFSEVVVLPENGSMQWNGPPEYLQLHVSLQEENMSQTSKYYQYEFVSPIQQYENSEPELEEKVILLLPLSCY